MFDPRSVLTSGAPIPSVDPEQFKRAFEIFRSSAGSGAKAIGVAAFAAQGIPIATHPEIFFRSTHLLFMLQKGALSEFVRDGEVDSRLLDLFASFPFQVRDVQPNGVFRLNDEEFERALEEIRK